MSELAWSLAGLGLGLALGLALLWRAERRARLRQEAALEVQLAWLQAALRDLARSQEALRDLVQRAESAAGPRRPSPEQTAQARDLQQAAREAEVAHERTRELRRALQASQRSLFGRAQLLSPERGLIPAEDLGVPGLLEPPPPEPRAAEAEPARTKLVL